MTWAWSVTDTAFILRMQILVCDTPDPNISIIIPQPNIIHPEVWKRIKVIKKEKKSNIHAPIKVKTTTFAVCGWWWWGGHCKSSLHYRTCGITFYSLLQQVSALSSALWLVVGPSRFSHTIQGYWPWISCDDLEVWAKPNPKPAPTLLLSPILTGL